MNHNLIMCIGLLQFKTKLVKFHVHMAINYLFNSEDWDGVERTGAHPNMF